MNGGRHSKDNGNGKDKDDDNGDEHQEMHSEQISGL
jgi:hypothetical protein